MEHFRKGWHASSNYTYIKFDEAVRLIVIFSLELESVITYYNSFTFRPVHDPSLIC